MPASKFHTLRKAGKRMIAQVGAYLREKSCPYQVIIPPEGKDWNEAVCQEVSAIKSLREELCEGGAMLDFTMYQEKFTSLCQERGLSFKTKYHSEQELVDPS
ncbi:MAG: toprim domain-containing protein [Cytophagales bacterium]|nr:toprim domain-containing protein [Cytophagales bacterium]